MQRGRVTKILIGINLLVFLADYASNGSVSAMLELRPESVFFTPWTIITSGFAHWGWLHILLNMYSLWIFGEAIEEIIGAYFIIIRAMGFRSSQMLVLIGLNVVIGFTNPTTAITAHIGGLLAGAGIAWYYTTRKR